MKKYTANGVEISEGEIRRLYNELTKKPDKKLGELMVSHLGSFITFRTEEEGFGFLKGVEWIDNSRWFDSFSSDYWQPATPEQLEEYKKMLIEHAKSKGYKDGNFKCLTSKKHTFPEQESIIFSIGLSGVWTESQNLVHSFKTGKWADIIEQEESNSEEQYYIEVKALGTVTAAINVLRDLCCENLPEIVKEGEQKKAIGTLLEWQERLFSSVNKD